MKKIVVTNETIKNVVKQEIECLGNNADLNHIDTSRVTDMCDIFSYSDFNGDISKWDVSNVTDMEGLFYESKFNGDISKWDVSNVKNMSYMFYDSAFNGDISEWDVSNVTDMTAMFYHSSFNGDISNWDISKVTDMNSMFSHSKFNGDISKWDISKVTDMSSMFSYSKFNGDISNWDISNVITMTAMFYKSDFNGDISKWENLYYVPKNLKIGYKKVKTNNFRNCIAKLEFFEDSILLNDPASKSKKCRTNKCKVVGFFNLKGKPIKVKECHSYYDPDFKYHVGDVFCIEDFDHNRYNECSTGIHFFENQEDAIYYVFN